MVIALGYIKSACKLPSILRYELPIIPCPCSRQQSMANVPTLGCSQVREGVVVGCSSEEGMDRDRTNCSVLGKSSIGAQEGLRSADVEEFESHYGSDQECRDSDVEGDSGEIQNLSASQSSLIEVNSDGSGGSKLRENVVNPDQSSSLAITQCSSLGQSEALVEKCAN